MKPATPLPYRATPCPCGHQACTSANVSPVTNMQGAMQMADAQYLAHAGNAYPKLVAALLQSLTAIPAEGERLETRALIHRLLRELGETFPGAEA